MNIDLPEISFDNRDNPNSFFDIVTIEELLQRELNHNIGKNHLVKFYIIFFVYEGQGYHTIDFTVLVKHIESEYNIKDNFSTGITRSALHILITKLFRIKAQKGQFIKKKKYMSQFLVFQETLERDCFKSKRVQYYAHELGVSTKTLNNIVNNVVNTSAKAFIDERTIMQIKRLLISTDHSIKEIAYTAGFSDPTNFFKYFKKFTGTSPDLFRQAH